MASNNQADFQQTPKELSTQDILSDDTTSAEEEDQDPTLHTTEEEKRGTIPGSTQAMAIALAMTWAQANPVVERFWPRKIKKNKSKKVVKQTSTQTDNVSK